MLKLFLIAALVALPASLWAQDADQLEVSASVGYLFEGDNLYFAEADSYYYVGDAFILKAEGTYYPSFLSRHLGIGVYANVGKPYYDGFEDTFMFELGPTIKARFPVGPVRLVPSLYVGYRHYGNDAGSGLGLNFSVQAQYPLHSFIPFLDVGFLTQPAGGNDATDITYSPVFLVGGGVAFAL